MAEPESTCLLIADISGYAEYLAGVEIDHAQDVLADLISTVVTSLRPTFRLAKLEGDAAFCFAPAATIDGSLLLDTVERCYFGFRRRRRDVRQATSCECNACIRIPDLNLKFVAHHGRVVRHRVVGREELVGSDVIVVHRLLKNDVVDRLGVQAYALLTDALVAEMEVDPTALAMRPYTATYEGVGEIAAWVHDLEARWQEEDARRRVFVEPGEALLTVTADVHAPPQVVWEFVTTPGRRMQWQAGIGVTGVEQVKRPGGRRGVGMLTHCMHGPDVSIEEILDWRPFDYFTDRSTLPGIDITFVSTFELEPTANGTRLEARIARPRSKKDRQVLEQVAPELEEAMNAAGQALVAEAAREAALRNEDRLEPDLPRATPGGPLAGARPIEIVG